MKFTLSWLREHLDTNASLTQITDTLTAIGLEVEQVTDLADGLNDFSVAEIVEAVQHPNADKLRVCKVNDGAGVRQVVCGAPNARAGIKVVLAKEGVKIPENGMVIKKSAIRGVESNGMLCSAHELALSEDSEGIIELPASAVVGESVVAALHLDDPMIEIAITPNRADCLGVHGVARDLAAAGLGKLKDRKAAAITGSFKSPITVKLETPGCPLFIGCYVKGVKNGPSPEWLQNRLKAIGLRPISALVDITNYMTFTYGRPLHVFDAKKLKGNVTVRYAKDGEKLSALNDKEYTLTSNMVAVCDDRGVVGLGGVIGGTATGCSDDTTDVYLEAAYFDPVHIATTGRALAIDSDARYRFERGVDPDFVKPGAEIAINLIKELCGGEESELVIAGKSPEWKREIAFDLKKVESLGGITISQDKIQTIFPALGFAIHGNKVQPPSWRADVEGQADLVEEVLRISGYDKIPSLALLPLPAKAAASAAARVSLLRRMLAANGMTEICSWAFLPDAQAKLFGGENEALKLLNPISTDLDTMRPSLIPNQLSALARNIARGFSSLSFFETGNVFKDVTPEGHVMMIAGIRSHEAVIRNHLGGARLVDIFDAKADLFSVLEVVGLNPAKLQVERMVPNWYHPTRAGRISLGGKVVLGYFGEVHPLILSAFDIKCKVVAFEVFVGAIPPQKAKGKAKPSLVVSNFQAVERDFAFNADERTQAADIVKAVESVDKQLIQSVNVFDVYAGKGIEAGKKSVAISVTLQAVDRTLSDKEITDVSQKIITAAAGLGLTLRS